MGAKIEKKKIKPISYARRFRRKRRVAVATGLSDRRTRPAGASGFTAHGDTEIILYTAAFVPPPCPKVRGICFPLRVVVVDVGVSVGFFFLDRHGQINTIDLGYNRTECGPAEAEAEAVAEAVAGPRARAVSTPHRRSDTLQK